MAETSNIEQVDSADYVGAESPVSGRFHKFELPRGVNSSNFVISTPEDFDAASKIAHAYAKDFSPQGDINVFSQLGLQISRDFQFDNKEEGGRATIAGQLRSGPEPVIDCKLPTLLLGLSWQELNPDSSSRIIFTKQNTDHPYIAVQIDGITVFGHFKSGKEDASRSRFEVLNVERTADLNNFIQRGKTVEFTLNAQGMKEMDELFNAESTE